MASWRPISEMTEAKEYPAFYYSYMYSSDIVEPSDFNWPSRSKKGTAIDWSS